jgi:hypothetical protein
MIEIVRCYNFVFNPSVEKLQDVLCSLALEDKEVFHNELFLLCPSDPESLLQGVCVLLILQTSLVQKIENPLIVDLKKGAEYVDVLTLLLLHSSDFLEEIMYSSLCDTHLLIVLLYYRPLCHSIILNILTVFLIVITLHSECLSRSGLTVSKNCCVIALQVR